MEAKNKRTRIVNAPAEHQDNVIVDIVGIAA